MKLAVSDSPLSRKLLEQGGFGIDYLETTGPYVNQTVRQFPKQKCLLHNSVWDWSLAHPEALAQKEVLSLTKERLKLSQAPWLSIHLGFSAAEVAYKDGMQALSPTLPRDELLEAICDNVLALKQHLNVPLLLENLDYNLGGAYEFICEAEFIAEVLENSDTAFLLDLAHMQVSAFGLSYTLDDYQRMLPLHRVKQLHISSPRMKNNKLSDAHEALTEDDYRLLENVLGKTEPWVVTLEYQKDETCLLEQIHRLEEILETT
jgi:uncharacterized protein (UPF0276 family)